MLDTSSAYHFQLLIQSNVVLCYLREIQVENVQFVLACQMRPVFGFRVTTHSTTVATKSKNPMPKNILYTMLALLVIILFLTKVINGEAGFQDRVSQIRNIQNTRKALNATTTDFTGAKFN